MKDYIIVGAGQAGLAMAYYLNQQNKDYIILDANDEVGAPWLKRWDSLKLFTPSEFNHLPGLHFPHENGHYANKYEVADYLKSYVEKFNIPIEFNQKVISLKKQNEMFTLKTKDKEYRCNNVIVATGPFHTPYTPPCSTSISKDILQIHSEHYKSPNQLKDGDTLVVGAGDSGVQILEEISNTNRKVFFSGDSTVGSLPQEFLGKTLWWWLKTTKILSANKYTWFGKVLMNRTQPIIGTDTKALFKKENVTCIGRTLSANEKEIIFKDCKISTIKNIVWATGFRPNFTWIEGEELCKHGYPNHYRGISNTEGLYYIGLPWLYTRGSATLGGVSKDTLFLSQYITNKKLS